MEVEGLVNRMEKLCKNLEFHSFLIGFTNVDEDVKKKLKRNLGRILGEKLGKVVDFSNPDILFTIDPQGNISLWIKPIYIYGRYRKLVGGIPQTHWPCRVCRGKGCKRCGWKGRMYDESVEEIVAKPIQKACGCEGSRMHALGREDIDARMLGKGRPFVLELTSPKVRSVDLRVMEKEIGKSGKVEVVGLKFVDKKMIKKLKEAKSRKTYSALVKVSGGIAGDDVMKLRWLEGSTILQKTPKRVTHRRVMKTRRKKIWEVRGKKVDKDLMRITVKADSGTYIKEFISGDDGRTTPSVSEVLGKEAICLQLDVIDVEFEDDVS